MNTGAGDTFGPPSRRRLQRGDPLGSAYVLLDELGTGSTGSVRLAWSYEDRTYYAAKILSPHLTANKELMARFMLERAALTRLSSDKLVRVHDLVAEGEVFAIVMDYIGGGTLSDDIAENGRFDLDETLSIAEDTASCLELLHAAGLVHGQVTARNILLEVQPEMPVSALLSDFGVARLFPTVGLAPSSNAPEPDTYTAPEVVPGYVSPTAEGDVYSLGVVIVECLTGERPTATANSVQVPDLADIPSSIRDLVAGMMATEIWLRPIASDVVTALSAIRAELEVAEQVAAEPLAQPDVHGKASRLSGGGDPDRLVGGESSVAAPPPWSPDRLGVDGADDGEEPEPVDLEQVMYRLETLVPASGSIVVGRWLGTKRPHVIEASRDPVQSRFEPSTRSKLCAALIAALDDEGFLLAEVDDGGELGVMVWHLIGSMAWPLSSAHALAVVNRYPALGPDESDEVWPVDAVDLTLH
jgi:serine/threonine protein kinase